MKHCWMKHYSLCCDDLAREMASLRANWPPEAVRPLMISFMRNKLAFKTYQQEAEKPSCW
jgi:hypothetical protein